MSADSTNKKYMLFVPGRLCVLGEHSDWAAGYRKLNPAIEKGAALVVCTKQGIYATVEKSELLTINNADTLPEEVRSFSVRADCETLKEIAASDDFYARVAGTALYMLEHYNVGGLRVDVTKMNLPVKKGLSSSATVCVLIARAYNLTYSLKLTPRQEADAAYHGERMTHSKCGRLDQLCAYGEGAFFAEFDGDNMTARPLPVKDTIALVYTDIGKTKDTIKILSALQAAYPFAKNEAQQKAHLALGRENLETVASAKEALQKNNAALLGSLMQEAQMRFDACVAPLCPEQLSSPVLHRLLSDDGIKRYAYGGKGVGSQGDGSAQFVAKDKTAQAQLIEYIDKTMGLRSYSLEISPSKVKRAIIPVAGMGTRMYPFTRSTRKELLPLIDGGMTKPAVLILLEQLHNSGIEEICLVVSSEQDVRFYTDFLQKDLPQHRLDGLPDAPVQYERLLRLIGERVSFAVQKSHTGFGGAVLCAREFTRGEPAVVLLGDTVHRSYTAATCTAQLISAFEETGKTTVAISRIELSRLSCYGAVTGRWDDRSPYLLHITDTVEKPDATLAEGRLAVGGKNREGFYAYAGQYIVTPQVFDELDRLVKSKRADEETTLTEAFGALCPGDGLFGLAVQGEWFDLGSPEEYRASFLRY